VVNYRGVGRGGGGDRGRGEDQGKGWGGKRGGRVEGRWGGGKGGLFKKWKEKHEGTFKRGKDDGGIVETRR